MEVNVTAAVSMAWAQRVKDKSPPLSRVGLVFTCASQEAAQKGARLGISPEISSAGWETWFTRGFAGQDISPTWAMEQTGFVMFDRICGVAQDAGYQIGAKYTDGTPMYTQVLNEDEAAERLQRVLPFGGPGSQRPTEQFIRSVKSRLRPELTVAAFVGPPSNEQRPPSHLSHTEKIQWIADRTRRFHGAMHGAGITQVFDSLAAVNADQESNARLFAEIISMPGQIGPGFGVEPPGRDYDNIRYWYSMSRCVVMKLDRYHTIVDDERARVEGGLTPVGQPWIGLDHLRNELNCTPYVWVVDPALQTPESRLSMAMRILREDPDVGVLLPARDQTRSGIEDLLGMGWDRATLPPVDG